MMGGEVYLVEEGVVLDDVYLDVYYFDDLGWYGCIQVVIYDNGWEVEMYYVYVGY